MLIFIYHTFGFKIFILYLLFSPQKYLEIFCQFLGFLLEVFVLDLNVGAVLGNLLKPSV